VSPTPVDDLDHPVPLSGPPARIVSLIPSLSETLWWWHLADRVVGVTDWCVAPPHGFPRATRVRGTKNPDTAAVIALAPDLVVANEEENRDLDVVRLREAGVPVYVTKVRSVTEAASSLAALAAVLGVEAAGAGLAQDIQRALARLPTDVTPLSTFCPVWRDPWMAVGTDTFSADLLARAGFHVVPEQPRYPTVDLADIADVDAVLLPDEPYAFSDVDREAFAGWSARVRLIDGTALTWWGPRTPSALVSLARLAAHVRRRGRRAVSSAGRPAT
jgi:ABC-type Fe3+-hydroxamate transport system substrate-binding protein